MPGFKPFFSRQSQKIATGNDDGHSGQQDEANVSEGYKTRRIINHKRALSGYYPEKERPVSKTRKLGQFVFRGGLDKKSMLQSISDPNVAKYTHEMRPDVDRPCLDAPQDPSSFNSHLLAENSQVDSAAEDDLTMAAPTKIDKSGPRDNNGSDELSTGQPLILALNAQSHRHPEYT
ncbi:MAG: hypothetical protein M1814_001238 [Vezdaea aestivalis]|nr:MAG: hypothetical protein M1814_001238 [Vezdaea aestivalis]